MSFDRLRQLVVSWPRKLLKWAAEPDPLWLCLSLAVLALYFVLGPGRSESQTRLVGLALQLCGLATVGWGIRKTRKFFGLPPLASAARDWLRRVPRPFGRVVEGHVLMAGEAGFGVEGSARLSVDVRPDATLEERVAAIESRVRELDQRHEETRRLLDREARDRQAALDEERTTREKVDNEIRSNLTLSQTGGLYLSVVGLVWLSLGLTLSTASVEIARLLGPR